MSEAAGRAGNGLIRMGRITENTRKIVLLNKQKARELRRELKEVYSNRAIARRLGISRSVVDRI